MLDNVVVEHLAVNQPYTYQAYDPSTVSSSDRTHPNDTKTPQYFGSGKLHLEIDMEYSTLVQWDDTVTVAGSSQPVLTAAFDERLGIPISELKNATDERFVSFRLIELIQDDGPEQGSIRAVQPESVNNGGAEVSGIYGEGLDVKGVVNERSGLARRRMLSTLAPQTLESPLFFHLTSGGGPGGAAQFEAAVQQVVDVGFDMIIYSFGSGFDWESTDDAYIQDIANRTRRALSLGVEVAGYDLIGWTRVPPNPGWIATDPINPKGTSACMASGWYDWLSARVFEMIDRTGISGIETDGPYGGYHCSNASHEHHHGSGDSVYQQWNYQAKFYRRLRDRGVYIHAPDGYFFAGINKNCMGSSEQLYSMPRQEQFILARQEVYFHTFQQPTTSAWTFVPIGGYHSDNPQCQLEPIGEHLRDYEHALASNIGLGVGACWRGARLFDPAVPESKALVKKWVAFYKTYRRIVTSDLIHVRAPDGQSVDCMLHVNPRLPRHKGLAMLINPTDRAVNETIVLPLYYTGLTGAASISREGAETTRRTHRLDARSRASLTYSLPAFGVTWFLVEPAM